MYLFLNYCCHINLGLYFFLYQSLRISYKEHCDIVFCVLREALLELLDHLEAFFKRVIPQFFFTQSAVHCDQTDAS